MGERDADGYAALVESARTGDEVAVANLVRAVQPLVLQCAHRLLPHHEDAEEAAQDALLAICSKLSSYDPARGPFGPWARTVAANSARSTYRSMKRRYESHAGPVPDLSASARTSVIAGARVDLLDALESLERDHPATVEAFVLRDLAGLSYDEIAVVLGAPVGSVKARVSRARAHLRTLLSN